MPRPPRIDFPGAWHHVFHRGARREPIFGHPGDCDRFLGFLHDGVTRSGIEVHAYALMPNHYHLLVRSPLGTLSRGMQVLNGNYTQWVNSRQGWDGAIFRGRFSSVLITDPGHLRYLLAYLHLNPIQAKLALRLTDHSWTSHRAYLGTEPKPPWLLTDHFLEMLDGPEGLQRFVSDIHRGRQHWPDSLDRETGRPLPSAERAMTLDLSDRSVPLEGHREQLKDLLSRVAQHCDTPESKILEATMGRGANPARRFAAWALSFETHFTRREIGEILGMRSAQVMQQIARVQLGPAPQPLGIWMADWKASLGY